MRILGFLFGVVLLLPGACALGFMAASNGMLGGSGAIALLWLVCLLISAGGVAMIRKSLRAPDRAAEENKLDP